LGPLALFKDERMPPQVPIYSTPPAVAKLYGVDVHRVIGWIRKGELRAVNVGDGAKRPRFRINSADLAAFEAARSATPQPKVSRCRRAKTPGVIEFF
jgi:hypothetical protein